MGTREKIKIPLPPPPLGLITSSGSLSREVELL